MTKPLNNTSVDIFGEIINNARCDDHRCSRVQELNAQLKHQLYTLMNTVIGENLTREKFAEGLVMTDKEKDLVETTGNAIIEVQHQHLAKLFNIGGEK